MTCETVTIVPGITSAAAAMARAPIGKETVRSVATLRFNVVPGPKNLPLPEPRLSLSCTLTLVAVPVLAYSPGLFAAGVPEKAAVTDVVPKGQSFKIK